MFCCFVNLLVIAFISLTVGSSHNGSHHICIPPVTYGLVTRDGKHPSLVNTVVTVTVNAVLRSGPHSVSWHHKKQTECTITGEPIPALTGVALHRHLAAASLLFSVDC